MWKIFFAVLFALMALPAAAESDGWVPKRFYRIEDGRYVRADRPYREPGQYRHYRPRAVYHPPRRPQVAGWQMSIPSTPHIDRGCYASLAVVGDQAVTDQDARDQATKAWMQTARFAYGERFMDPANNDDEAFSCTRSSIGSIAGSVFHRCEITAKPCKAPKLKADR